VTADIPRHPTAHDRQIDKVRALVRQGVLGPCHRRWPEMKNAARRLGCRPEDAIWRVRHGSWSTDDNQLHIQTTLADVIREAATR
jgi:hypothetical protein